MADFQYRGRGSGFPNSRARLDEDIQMNGGGEEMDRPSPSNQQRRFDPVGGRYRVDYRNDHRRRRPQISSDTGRMLQRLGLPTVIAAANQGNRANDNDWYKIVVPKVKNVAKDFVISGIQNLSEMKFEPINFHEAGTSVAFFVQGKRTALSILHTSNKITLPDNSKMCITMQKLSSRPQIVMTAEVVEKLKLCMNKRYDVPTCSLNLSNLFNDDDMRREELCLDLNHSSVTDRVMAIISEHIPELKSLSLSQNRLTGLKQFSNLPLKAPHLMCLTLADNRLRNERELQFVDKLQLEELTLDANPLCNNFDDKQSYVRAIRKLFPKVVRLDGHILPPPITFDVDTPTALPVAKGNSFGNDHCQNIICQFINRYFEIYDCDSRQPLMEAYHPEVMFSLSTSNSRLLSRSANWMDYQINDRNLKSIRDTQKRETHLKRGQLDVVALLTKLPATQHSPQSFIVDVNMATPVMLTFTIHGVFKEKASKQKAIRMFTRTLVTIPSTTQYGLAIINEMLHLSPAETSANEKYFSTVTPAPDANSTNQLTEIQRQMIQQFSVQSGMNEIWSTRCLLENQWNYDQAAKVFVEVNNKPMTRENRNKVKRTEKGIMLRLGKAKQGIPPEAFFKS